MSDVARELERQRPAESKALVPTAAAPTTASLVRDAIGDAVEVFQAHLELAALELREDAKTAGRVAAGFGIGAALALLAVGFVGASAAFALALVMPAWTACLIVGLLVALAAVVAVGTARRKLKTHDFTPEHTMVALQEMRNGGRADADSGGRR